MVDDKFIMMNLDDERSKKVAGILGNKTCKRILDYLADNKEKSEEDISKDLQTPINTIEYNLKKLLETGLVEKAKKFFWSKRGKKINLYKVANKHIVISPKSKPSSDLLKTILPVIVAVAIVAVLALIFISQTPIGQDELPSTNSDKLKSFNSINELKNFLEKNSGNAYGGIESDSSVRSDSSESATAGSMKSSAESAKASDYSETNIQVEGVDEADIVKTDGKYIYAVSGKNISIIDAYPAENMNLLTTIEIENYATELFVNEDKLIMFGNYNYMDNQQEVLVYDISDKESPELEQEIKIDGYYTTSRMIDNFVYVISTKYAYPNNPMPPIYFVDGIKTEVSAADVAYIDSYDTNYVFTSILAIDLDSGEVSNEVFLTGANHNIYVSENNIFLTYAKSYHYENYLEEYVDEVLIKILPDEKLKIKEIIESDKSYWEKQSEISKIVEDYSFSLEGSKKAEFDKELFEETEKFQEEFNKKLDKTIIHKIEINERNIEYKGVGEVPGTVLNQFSMDEYDGYFRIATTTGQSLRSTEMENNLYILNDDLEIVGAVEGLAEGERIYSARFIGSRAYMVTFRQVDPLFVLDLSNLENPEMLGYLKVTGYSSYLHPYDDTHLIGIGKEATEEGRAQGVKIALFDVTDVENPIEISKYEVKERWSDSNALYDHKAFLFDKERELLVLPISYEKSSENLTDLKIYEYNYVQGAMVFKINLDGIQLRGEIIHNSSEEQAYYYGPYAIQRSLFMDDVLYTMSNKLIKANNLDLSEISQVKLPYEEQYVLYAEKGFSGVTDVINAVEAVGVKKIRVAKGKVFE